MRVHILATCRKPELLPYTELVFKTLRVGFPTAEVTMWRNGELPISVLEIAQEVGCLQEGTNTIHHKWIESLVKEQEEPFYVLDTDVIFYENFERHSFPTALAGWRTPEWKDDFTGAITRPRLHTSLLYIDPVKTKAAINEYEKQFPVTGMHPLANLFDPLFLPFNGKGYLYDTCSMLYHAIGGTPFKDTQLASFFHFNFGTISDLVLPRLKNGESIAKERARILENPELGRGRWRESLEYFAERQNVSDGADVIAPIKPEDARDALQWNEELCCGNRDAMELCDMWYAYCHGIDDLVDTMQDGRPMMSREQIISLFFKAAVFYNSRFFLQHRELFFPIVLQTTNTYADSVAWEKSPKEHLRSMGDVFRTCGNELYFMVALICGGYEHMRNMSMRIKERDWLGQHDAEGNPT